MLTGRIRYRRAFFGRLVVQVELERCVIREALGLPQTWSEWRDASPKDLAHLSVAEMERLAPEGVQP